ncbi:MAG: UDP-N-acetyl glucosamine 2-epimerase, partial [Rhodothermales bacterium]|nr:UDP-N-acetyl glucosamine 2-epimerase [Rhodothermales bacterium]
TIAGALVAAKSGLQIAHVEAGLRSFNRRMPEEINRIVTDSLSNILFAPTATAVNHLEREGVMGRIVLSGDVMLDSTMYYSNVARKTVDLTEVLGDIPEPFALATVHRAENTDDPERFRAILDAFKEVDMTIVFPVHPRTRNVISMGALSPNVMMIDPVGYLEMLRLVQGARYVLTDSGGLQKEAYWLGTPCITLRDETEWIETLSNRWNQLAGANRRRILACIDEIPSLDTSRPQFGMPMNRLASEVIAESLLPD